MSEQAARDTQRQLIEAIRKLGGRATIGDLMAATSRSNAEIENNILKALNAVGGHLAVDDNGEIIYSVKGSRKLPSDPWLLRFGRFLREAFKATFIAGLSIVLVAYFVFYIVLAVAIVVALIAVASRGGDADCDVDCDCKGCDACGECVWVCDGSSCNACGDSVAACFTCGGADARARVRQKNAAKREKARERGAKRREDRLQRRQVRTDRRSATIASFRKSVGLSAQATHLGLALEREVVEEQPPFLRAVRDYIFGVPRPLPDPLATETNALGFIRAHDGRMAASDMVMLTGLPLDQADAILLDIATRYDGNIEVTDAGVILYTFDRLLVSATSDPAVLAWIAEQGNAVTVEQLARRDGIDANEALARLQHLSQSVGGSVEHGATTRFLFPDDALALALASSEVDASHRDYTYCWERLEVSPAIVGLPIGGRGKVVGFNLTNLILGSLLAFNLANVSALLGIDFTSSGVAWSVAYIPLMFSASVFLIPLCRWFVRAHANRGRRKRNAHRVVLLALFHALEGDDNKVTAEEMSEVLFGVSNFSQFEHLERELKRLILELDGTIDIEAELSEHGLTYIFQRVFDELHAVHHARLQVDLDSLQLTRVVYDTSRDDAEMMDDSELGLPSLDAATAMEGGEAMDDLGLDLPELVPSEASEDAELGTESEDL